MKSAFCLWYVSRTYVIRGSIFPNYIFFVLNKKGSRKQQIYTTTKQNAFTTLTDRFGASKDENWKKRKHGFQHHKRVILQSSLKDDASLRYISQNSNNTITDLARKSNLQIQARS